MDRKSIFLTDGIEYSNIEIKDTFLSNAFLLEMNYLESLNIDRLLAGFAEAAGVQPKASRYLGWEVTEIQGHTLGHYLTAISQAYGATKKKAYLDKIEYVLSELQQFQASDGFLFASDRELFDRVENKKPVWVPWYTMHKILEGLLAAYRFTKSKVAYDVMHRLGIWIYNRCIAWTEEVRGVVLSVEYGGMNDCLYDLFMQTKEEKFAVAAHQFDEMPLFKAMVEQRDALNGLHANTTIPKIIGALKRYIALGETEVFYLSAAKEFWDMVVNHHTYITGGNSEWEHFGDPDILDDERTACNCETCNTYNMLKLTKYLFQLTGEKKYADYYERAFINTILSSQQPITGMTTYFQPMATGYFKVFTTPFDSFWCCTGSGMENFTKLTEGIYFYKEGRAYINRFVHSEASILGGAIVINVEADLLAEDKITITIQNHAEQELLEEVYIRIPEWLEKEPEVLSLTAGVLTRKEEGYLMVSGLGTIETTLTLRFIKELKMHILPDNKEAACFTYGPFVLSAGLGKQMMDTTYTGVAVLVPQKELMIRDYLILEQVNIQELKDNVSKYLIKNSDKPEFVLFNMEKDRRLVFTPHFTNYEERYGIYFRIYHKDSKDFKECREAAGRKQALVKMQIDIVPIGNDQYELAHHILGLKTDVQRARGHRCRYAKDNGWFSYDLAVNQEAEKLCTWYAAKDAGNTFDIYINDQLLMTETIISKPEAYYLQEYWLPPELITGKNTVTVKFQNKSSQHICRIFDEIYIKKYQNNRESQEKGEQG